VPRCGQRFDLPIERDLLGMVERIGALKVQRLDLGTGRLRCISAG
jgi:hypothetical protein